MMRIFLPLAVIASILFAPLMAGQPTVVGGIEKPNTVSGFDYVGPTIGCWREAEFKKFEMGGDCAPEGKGRGKAILAALVASIVAAAAGIVGMLPVVGRLTSIVTTMGGAAILAAMAYYAVTGLGGGDDASALQWGTYLAGGAGLLTLISGLSGMRGRHH